MPLGRYQDGSPPPDGGDGPREGSEPIRGGCACASVPHPGSSLLSLLGLLGLLVVRRRRR
ncbi:MAG: MYXO-CTERM sorting domain-containing protein [Myxococcota bacterium]|nr:MYXO-CTERM sorting domain-containing protein [Myxococcota bacterium]